MKESRLVCYGEQTYGSGSERSEHNHILIFNGVAKRLCKETTGYQMFNFTVSNSNLLTVTMGSARACPSRSEVSSSVSAGKRCRLASSHRKASSRRCNFLSSSGKEKKGSEMSLWLIRGVDDEICKLLMKSRATNCSF